MCVKWPVKKVIEINTVNNIYKELLRENVQTKRTLKKTIKYIFQNNVIKDD